MDKKIKQTKLDASGGMFLDPGNVGSFVSWCISLRGPYKWMREHSKYSIAPDEGPKEMLNEGHISGTIRLGDCSRQISWDFGDSNSIEKIDKAIKVLTDYRTKLVGYQMALKAQRKKLGIKATGTDEYGL